MPIVSGVLRFGKPRSRGRSVRSPRSHAPGSCLPCARAELHDERRADEGARQTETVLLRRRFKPAFLFSFLSRVAVCPHFGSAQRPLFFHDARPAQWAIRVLATIWAAPVEPRLELFLILRSTPLPPARAPRRSPLLGSIAGIASGRAHKDIEGFIGTEVGTTTKGCGLRTIDTDWRAPARSISLSGAHPTHVLSLSLPLSPPLFSLSLSPHCRR